MALQGRNYCFFRLDDGKFNLYKDSKTNSEEMHSIKVDSIANISACSRQEISLEFNLSNKNTEQLTEIRFYLPSQNQNANPAGVLVEQFSDFKAEDNKKNLAQFFEIPLMVPRGKYDLIFTCDQMVLHGKSYTYKIKFFDIGKVFQLQFDPFGAD